MKSELEIKKDFTSIYNQTSPRDYLAEMRRLEYRIPDYTSPMYQFLAEKIHENTKQPVKIFDIGSSYGINSALMTFDISMNDLDNFFLKKPFSKTYANDFFAQIPKKYRYFDFYLLDISLEALKFAQSVNLCKEAFCVNLEENDLGKTLIKKLPDIDLFISTGCIGYVGKNTFEKIFRAINKEHNQTLEDVVMPKPLFAFSLLRIFPVDDIKKIFEKNDFVLLKSEIKSLKQRRFYDDEEKEKTISLLKSRGVSTEYLETTGYYYADFYVGGPASQENLVTQWLEQMESSYLVPA